MKKLPFLTDRIRYRYRKFLLWFIPVRVYVLQTPLEPDEISKRLTQIIMPYRWYFVTAPPKATGKKYSGKFEPNAFTAVKTNPYGVNRSIKIIGNFFLHNDKIYVRLIMSNPFGIVNIMLLVAIYFLTLLFRFAPFNSFIYNVLLYLIPIGLVYLATNFSFQRIYKKEKLFFFKLFKGRRLTDHEITRIGI